jgi:hypothetical protein
MKKDITAEVAEPAENKKERNNGIMEHWNNG